MKIAFISDIHGNYDALKAVFKEIKHLNVKKIYCLGDIVNYYYDPDKCIDLLIKNKTESIRGNHEEIFLENLKNKKKRKLYAEKYGNSIYINFKILKKKHINFIKSLPKSLNLKIGSKKAVITHGAPWKIDFYFYKNVKDKWIKKIKQYKKEIFVLGHTHHPMKLKLNNNKIILNPGSVGQPRNKTKNACWLLINEKSMKMKFMETKYDNKKLINKITKYDQGNERLIKYFK